jgi:hypothetical protein
MAIVMGLPPWSGGTGSSFVVNQYLPESAERTDADVVNQP